MTNVFDNADHFNPWHAFEPLESFANRGGRRSPQFAGEILRDNTRRPRAVNVSPGQLSPSNQPRAQRMKVIGRDVTIEPERRVCIFIVLSLNANLVPARLDAFHRYRARKAGGGDSRNRCQLVDNLIFDMRDHVRRRDEILRNGDAEGLQVPRVRKAWLNLAQRLKGADHQKRADQQHQRHRNLRHHQHIARAQTDTAGARRSTSAGENRTTLCA